MPTDLSQRWLAAHAVGELVERRIYHLRSRNLDYGVWTGVGFIGVRQKFDTRFLFQEYPRNAGHGPVGTATAVAATGFTVPEEIELVEGISDGEYSRLNRPLFELLENLPIGSLWFVPGEVVYRRIGHQGEPRMRPDLVHIAAPAWAPTGLQRAVCGRDIGPQPYQWDRFRADRARRPTRDCMPCERRAEEVVLPEERT